MRKAAMEWTCIVCLLAFATTAAADSATYQIAASADDTRASSSNNYYTYGSVYWPCSSASTMGFLRWAIDIPAGATIDSAYLEVYVTSAYSSASTVQMQLLDYDNCPAFTSNPYSWSVTGSPVSWAQSSWAADTWNSSETDSVDLKTIVQAFIDRAGYSTGNYLGLRGVWTSGALRYIRAWDDTGEHTTGAKLVVTYTTGGGSNEPPVAEAGEDLCPEDADGDNSETVTLDGSDSSDSDGTIVSYVWKEGVTQIATGQTASVSLSVGTHTITLVVTDDDSDTADDTVTVTVLEGEEKEVTFSLELAGDDASASSGDSGVYNSRLYTPPSASDSARSFWRWACFVPPNATIREAYLKVKSDGVAGDSNPSVMRLQLVDSDDCDDFISNAYSRTVTANYEDWTVPATWTADEWYTSSDISSVVQEFIDRAGYEFGNYLGLRGSTAASGTWKRAYTYDYGEHTNGAQLEVHYAGGDAIIELLMADPEVRIAQPIYCWLFNARSGDTLRAKLDGEVIYQKAGPLDDEEVFLADYTELEAGEHTLLVEVLNGAGQARTSASRTWTTLHDGIPYVGINEYNAICVDGEPFFPVTPFILREDNFSGPVGDAINCTFGVGWYAVQNIANWQDYIDESWEEGWYAAGPIRWDGLDYSNASNADTDKLVDYVEACWDYSPGLLAWSWIDEPDLYNVEPPTLRNWVELTHANDTIHPVWINMTGYNFTRGEDEGWQSEAKKYSYLYNGYLFDGQRTMMADILGFDYYPYEFASKFAWCSLENYLLALDRLQEWNHDLMPAATFVEVCDQFSATDERLGDRDWTPAPTPAEVKNLVWASIIHGAKAISWFQMFTPTPEANLDVMAEAVTWINDLTPVILSPAWSSVDVTDVEQGSGRIDITVREVDDTLYIFAANIISGATETVQFNVEDLPASTAVDVYGESRSITSSAGYFTDTFDALEVHIYAIELGAAPEPTSVQYQIAASADDTRATSSNNYYTYGSVYWPCSSASTMGFLRWAVDIPAGATIESAYLKVYVTSSYGSASTVDMQLLDYDNCPAFTSNPYSWSVAGSPVSWAQSSWTADSWNSSQTDSVDMKTIVQAFIDRAGYSTGNYLGLRGVWTSGASRYIRAWDDSLTPLHEYGAVLDVTYTAP